MSILEEAIGQLSDIQRQAVEWNQGPMLVLAGPGSGKTQVLTCRIASLLDKSRDEKFRVLGLTFTNKAADEMKSRVASFVPGLEDRANIGTFHSFCAQILRQHGVHIGINPDFAIYSRDDDRKAVLEDALHRAQSKGKSISLDNIRYLGVIDQMKARLIDPSGAEKALVRFEDRKSIAVTYQLYEQELRHINALDFNSLIFEAYRLSKSFPAIAARYRKSYPYWLIDEFQDTNNAQYKFIRVLAADEFRNLFAVADDDQIIYAWNGANYEQIQSFLNDFSAYMIQLPTNYRCPPAIVEAANRLVAYNAQRTTSKKPIMAGKTYSKFPETEHIQLRIFATDVDEANGIAEEISKQRIGQWKETTVLARTRTLLESIHNALNEHRVPCVIAQRRDDFLSAEFRWLVAILRQLIHPLDQRNLRILVESFNRMTGCNVIPDQVIAESEATGYSYMGTWLELVKTHDIGPSCEFFVKLLGEKIDVSAPSGIIEPILIELSKKTSTETNSDLIEDLAAWRELERDIAAHIGKRAPLDQFLQELQLRSKEPTAKDDTVTLMTIHAAKGKEFEFVYVIGLVEDLMPSYQSKKKGEHSPEMEEERRNCFVAITRTKECLILSRAEVYRGWKKQTSRFLFEMELVT